MGVRTDTIAFTAGDAATRRKEQIPGTVTHLVAVHVTLVSLDDSGVRSGFQTSVDFLREKIATPPIPLSADASGVDTIEVAQGATLNITRVILTTQFYPGIINFTRIKFLPTWKPNQTKH